MENLISHLEFHNNLIFRVIWQWNVLSSRARNDIKALMLKMTNLFPMWCSLSSNMSLISCSIILCKTHGFKNWTRLACRTVDQWTFRFDPSQWTILWSNRHWTVQTNGWTVEPDKPFDFLQTGHSLILQIFVYYLRSPLSTRPIPRPTLTKLKLIISPS